MSEEQKKISNEGIILSSRRPPRNRNSASLAEILGWIPQVKSCRRAREVKPIHASNPALASFSIIFPLFLPFHSQSIMTSVLWRPQPACLPSSGVAYQRRWRNVHFQLENKAHALEGQSCMYGFYTCLICSRVRRAHNWSFILSSKLRKWDFYVVAVKSEFNSAVCNSKSITFTFLHSLPLCFLPVSATACVST